MDKFGREYTFLIDTNDNGQLKIELPFSMDFNIVRSTLSSANTAIFRIYNLNEDNRRRIAKDRVDYNLLKRCVFRGGYGKNVAQCFSGSVQRCYSQREGVDIVTTIEAFDARNSFSNGSVKDAQYPKGTTRKAIVLDLISQLKPFGVDLGTVGRITGTLSRGNSYTGSIVKILDEITDGKFFIDNGLANVLNEDEYAPSFLRVIDSDNGLLGTPIRENLNLDLNIIFEPRLTVGQRVAIRSSVNLPINGNYKIVSLNHQGMISGSVAGSATTRVGCIVSSNSYEVKA